MLHKRGDLVAFRVKSVGEEDREASGIAHGEIIHTDSLGHYIRVKGDALCCDHYVADWELMYVIDKSKEQPAIYKPRPLLPGDEVWFKVLVYEARRPPARECWQQSQVTLVEGGIVHVSYYKAPFVQVLRALPLNEVQRTCPGEPLFSC